MAPTTQPERRTLPSPPPDHQRPPRTAEAHRHAHTTCTYTHSSEERAGGGGTPETVGAWPAPPHTPLGVAYNLISPPHSRFVHTETAETGGIFNIVYGGGIDRMARAHTASTL